ncbi:MAG TPA: hypothetical protein VNG12_22195 [Acidimicrobiales bacterium]|nr:hypothetical protein [Acidimicrobiales bacterium]
MTTKSPYRRWLSCPDRLCPDCRAAEAAYVEAGASEQTDVLLMALEYGFSHPHVTLEGSRSVSEHVTRGTRGDGTTGRAPVPVIVTPQYVRWLDCPDQRCHDCRATETAFLEAGPEEQTAVLLMALDRGLAPHEPPLVDEPLVTRPLVPLAAMAPVSHVTTTHRRRRATTHMAYRRAATVMANRRATAVMAMVGVAAALLLALGLTNGISRTPTRSAAPTQPGGGDRSHAPASTGPAGGKSTPSAPLPATTGSAPVSVPAVLATASTSSVATPATVSASSPGNGSGTGVGAVNGTTPSAPTTPTGTTGPTGTTQVSPSNPHAPVTTLVGGIVTAAGTSVGNTANQLGAALPPVSPVTGVVSVVGGSLASLGTRLGT